MRLFCSCFLGTLVILVAGCSQRTVSPSTASPTAGPTSDDVLMSALIQLSPENFGINSDAEKAVSLLNSWRFKSAEQLEKKDVRKDAADESHPIAAPSGWIPNGEETRLAQSQYDLGDAVHVRDSMLFHTISGFLSDRGRTEEQKVNIVVDFVCRNVSLWKDDEIELPLPPFLTLELGRGNADDRAWVCSAILRQLRLDSCIIRAKSDTKESTDKWLFGVGVEAKVYLYDMHLGLPVSNGDSTATLADIATHPEWLEQMSAQGRYRLTNDDLRDPAIFLIPDPQRWCHRMKSLEQVLPAKYSCFLYDPLTESDGNQGVLRRVSETYHWPVESLKQWRFPRRQTELSRNPSSEVQQELSRFMIPLTVPIPFQMSEDGKVAIGTPERKLQRCRIDQLQGQFSDAVQRYLRVVHLGVESFPPDLDRLNRLAVEDASYWTAICKFELGQFDAAASSLTDYLKKHDRKGNWHFPARTLLSQCRIELGQIPEAIAALERTSTDDPDRDANALRLKRLRSKK